jgi:DNA-binding transcriptional ArsR family regulator
VLSTHDRNVRRFQPAITGQFEEPWEHLPQTSASWMVRHVERERDADLAARTPGYHRDMVARGWDTLLRLTRRLAEEIEHGAGARLSTGTRMLGRKIGMSQSTASRCLRRLREMNLLTRYREHRVRFLRRTVWDPVRNLLIRRPGRWEGKAAVHEVMTHRGSGPPEGLESRPLTSGDAWSEVGPPSVGTRA